MTYVRSDRTLIFTVEYHSNPGQDVVKSQLCASEIMYVQNIVTGKIPISKPLTMHLSPVRFSHGLVSYSKAGSIN